jgi:deoxyribonuclease-4
MIRIGPSGNSNSFYESGREHTYQEAEWLRSLGLNAFEYSFGRGVKITDSTAAKIAEEMRKYDIALSVHAPYYTNLASLEEEKVVNSFRYVAESVIAARKMGGKRVVFHPASQGKDTRENAVARTRDNMVRLCEAVKNSVDFDDYVICPETMGKIMQIGTADEVIDFCTLDPHLIPCFDFGHINSYMHGGLKTKDDYKRIIDLAFDKLGQEKANVIHIHFSKIMYSDKGEVKHLTFADDVYGPEYEPLAEIIDEYGMSPVIICESDGTMAEDALKIKKCHKNV